MILHLKLRQNTVYLYFNYNKEEIYISTGVRIKTLEKGEKWTKIVQKIVQPERGKIEDKKRQIFSAIADLEANQKPVNGENVRQFINNIGKKPDKSHIDNVILRFLFTCKTKNTQKKIGQLRDKFKRFSEYYGKDIYVEDFNKDVFEAYEYWLTFIDKKVSKAGKEISPLGNNTISTHISSLRTVLRFTSPNQSWNFIKHTSEYYNVVYLFPEELKILENSDEVINPKWIPARDIFLIMCYTGVRHSDVKMLIQSNYVPEFNTFVIFQTKTEKEAYPPSSPGLKFILDRYTEPPHLSNQKLNKGLKKIFTTLKLNRTILIRRKVEGRKMAVSYPLNEVITSHVARKTFIMTLLGTGTSENNVMDYTGHSSLKAMKPYVTVNQRKLSEVTARIQLLFKGPENPEPHY